MCGPGRSPDLGEQILCGGLARFFLDVSHPAPPLPQDLFLSLCGRYPWVAHQLSSGQTTSKGFPAIHCPYEDSWRPQLHPESREGRVPLGRFAECLVLVMCMFMYVDTHAEVRRHLVIGGSLPLPHGSLGWMQLRWSGLVVDTWTH